jgi:hypothetical protein
MVLTRLQSDNWGQRREFISETAIHFPGLKGLAKPIEWVFPTLLVCLNCGTAELLSLKPNYAYLATLQGGMNQKLAGQRGSPSDMSETRP